MGSSSQRDLRPRYYFRGPFVICVLGALWLSGHRHGRCWSVPIHGQRSLWSTRLQRPRGYRQTAWFLEAAAGDAAPPAAVPPSLRTPFTPALRRSGSLPERLLGALIRRLDVNKDGKLTLEDVQLALDVNGDGSVDIDDVFALLDFNGDGKFDMQDILYLLDFNRDGKVDFDDIVHVLDVDGDGNVDFKDIVYLLDSNKDGKLDMQDIVHMFDLNKDGQVNFKDVEYLLDLNKDGKVDYEDVRYAEDMLVAGVEGKAMEVEESISRIAETVNNNLETVLDDFAVREAQFATDLRLRVVRELRKRERLEVFFRAVPACLRASKGMRAKLRALKRCRFILFGDFNAEPRRLEFQKGDSVVSVVISQVVARHLQRVGNQRGLDLDGDGRVTLRDVRAMADMGAVISSSVIGAAALDANYEGAAASVGEAGAALRGLLEAETLDVRSILSEAMTDVRSAQRDALESLKVGTEEMTERLRRATTEAERKIETATAGTVKYFAELAERVPRRP